MDQLAGSVGLSSWGVIGMLNICEDKIFFFLCDLGLFYINLLPVFTADHWFLRVGGGWEDVEKQC